MYTSHESRSNTNCNERSKVAGALHNLTSSHRTNSVLILVQTHYLFLTLSWFGLNIVGENHIPEPFIPIAVNFV